MATAEVPDGRVRALEQVVSYLVSERQRLRREGADSATLEANRRALASMHAHLGSALGQQHAQQQRATPPDQAEAPPAKR